MTRLLNSGAEPYAHVCLLACRLRKWGNQVLLYKAGILNSCALHSASDKRAVWISPLISLGSKHGKYVSSISFFQSKSRQQAALPGNYPQEPTNPIRNENRWLHQIATQFFCLQLTFGDGCKAVFLSQLFQNSIKIGLVCDQPFCYRSSIWCGQCIYCPVLL